MKKKKDDNIICLSCGKTHHGEFSTWEFAKEDGMWYHWHGGIPPGGYQPCSGGVIRIEEAEPLEMVAVLSVEQLTLF